MTNLQTLAPQMISGKGQGRLLSFLSKMQFPKNAIEIGTFTGYSALCLAEGLVENGILHTFEIDSSYDPIIDYARSEVELSKKIIFHKGNVIELIDQIKDSFDLAFVDAAKKDYLLYLQMLEPRMKKGALLISDNVLWSGKVLDENKDQETEILDQYNKYLQKSEKWEVLILPLRDGISIAKRI